MSTDVIITEVGPVRGRRPGNRSHFDCVPKADIVYL